MGTLDRRKNHIDVLERVLDTVRDSTEGEPRNGGIITVDVHPAAGGSAIARESIEGSERPMKPHANDDHPRDQDHYDSDRRGEHRYPDDGRRESERPSQRERDELKERLERRS